MERLGGREGDRTEAYLLDDNKVEIRYKYNSDCSKEVTYLKLLQGNKGIPILYSTNYGDPDENPVAVVERLYSLVEILDKNILSLTDILIQMIDLLELLYNHNICHRHLEYFTMSTLDGEVKFIDCRQWCFVYDIDIHNESVSNVKCLRQDIYQMCRLITKLNKNIRDRSIGRIVDKIYDLTENARTINSDHYQTLRDMVNL